MTEPNEPSMEDILASIRNILADEEEKEMSQTRPVSASVTEDETISSESSASTFYIAENQEDEGIVELTSEMIVGETKKIQEALVVTPEEEEDDDFQPEPVIPVKPMKEETLSDLIQDSIVSDIGNDEVLLSAPTIQAAATSLSSLRSFAGDKKAALGKGNLTIEAIVRESVKPYLKEWLDVNLPAIVERIVKKEVAHIMDRLDIK